MRIELPLGLVLLLAPALASADLIGPPPTNCVEGSMGRSSGLGGWCEPTVCGTDDATCPEQPFCEAGYWQNDCANPEPWSCSEEPMPLCVRTEMRSRRGLGGPGPEVEIRVAVGPCDAGDGCPEGATCEAARRCTHAPAPAEEEVAEEEEEMPVVEADETTHPPTDETPPASSGCGCRVAPSSETRWCWLALVVLALRRRASR